MRSSLVRQLLEPTPEGRVQGADDAELLGFGRFTVGGAEVDRLAAGQRELEEYEEPAGWDEDEGWDLAEHCQSQSCSSLFCQYWPSILKGHENVRREKILGYTG